MKTVIGQEHHADVWFTLRPDGTRRVYVADMTALTHLEGSLP